MFLQGLRGPWQCWKASEHPPHEPVLVLPSFPLSFILRSPQFKGSSPEATAANTLTPETLDLGVCEPGRVWG